MTEDTNPGTRRGGRCSDTSSSTTTGGGCIPRTDMWRLATKSEMPPEDAKKVQKTLTTPLGKQLSKQITPAFHDEEALAEQDAHTRSLIAFYRARRK